MKSYFIYILANQNKVLYVVMTGDLSRRIFEHKQGFVEGFTKKYRVNKLVYYEILQDAKNAINRERQLKNWHRQWKVNLIESMNKEWRDLYSEIEDPYKIIYS